MPAASANAVLFLIGATVAALAFIGVVFGANVLLSPRNPTSEKVEPYECGMDQAGSPHVRVPLRFAAIAIIFVIFDAESVLLFAVAARIKGSMAGGLAVLAFLVGLLLFIPVESQTRTYAVLGWTDVLRTLVPDDPGHWVREWLRTAQAAHVM